MSQKSLPNWVARNVILSSCTTFLLGNRPIQKHGNDCGVFMCKFADYLSGNLELRFEAGDMPYFRDRMALELEAQAVA